MNRCCPSGCESKPRIRFRGFTDAWERRKLGEIIISHPFVAYLQVPLSSGDYPVIQQGNEAIIGYSNGIPFKDFKDVVLFGDHTLSLYKPITPFFIATDGIRILSAKDCEGNFLYALLTKIKPESEGYKRHFHVLNSTAVSIVYNKIEQAKIGNFFKQLDALIALHQRKHKHRKKTSKC